MEQNIIGRKAGKAVTWSLLTQVFSKLVSPITNMILARLLAPEAFGAIATINVVIAFAETFTDAGFQKYIVQHDFSDENELDKSTNVAFWTNTFISLFFIIVIFFARNPIANLVGSPKLGNAIFLASFNILLVTFSSTQTARYNRDMDFKTLFYARVVTVFVPVIVTIPLAFLMRNYWALLIGTLATNLVNAIVLATFSKWKPDLHFNFDIFKNMFSFSLWILLDAIAVWLTAYIGTFIVGRHLDDHHLGLYKTAMTTVNSLTTIFSSAITPVMFSQLSRCQNDKNKMKTTFYMYQRLSGVLLIPLGMGMFMYRDLLRLILLGDQWVEITEFLGIWGLISSITIIFSNYCSTFYRSNGKPRLSFIAQLVYLSVLIPALLFSVQSSFRALYYARSLATVYASIQSFIIMRIVFKFKIYQTIYNVFPIIVSSLLMGVAAFGLQQLGSSILWQILSVLICIVVYFTILLTLFPKIRKELLELAKFKSFLKKLRRN